MLLPFIDPPSPFSKYRSQLPSISEIKGLSNEIEENFVMNLTKAQFDLLENFFVSIPKYKQEIEFDCPACNTHNKTVVEGPASFF
jgi:hypothetical protein